jgi:hypothetical protein
VLLPSDTHRKPITSITLVLLQFVTYLLTLPLSIKKVVVLTGTRKKNCSGAFFFFGIILLCSSINIFFFAQHKKCSSAKSSIYWDTTPYSPVKVNRRLGGTYRLRFQCRRVSHVSKQHEAGNKHCLFCLLPASCCFLTWLTLRP